jgi:hypothetical protein
MFGGIPSKIIALARKVPPVLPDLRTLFAWGLGTSGQLGDGGVTNRSSPVQAKSGISVGFTVVITCGNALIQLILILLHLDQ